MRISDKERRRAVAELREASTGAYRHVDALDVIAGSVGVVVAGKFSHEVENETYAALADLIDRPTCRNEESLYDRSFLCSWCGYEATTYDDSNCNPSDFLFCPNCGAEVKNEVD